MNRHFKKYYFYFVARLIDLLSLHDQTIAYYSKVIQIRTLLWNVQKSHIAAYQKIPKKSYLEIHGGLGDLLKDLLLILKNKPTKYIVVTHFLKVKDYVKYLIGNELKLISWFFIQED